MQCLDLTWSNSSLGRQAISISFANEINLAQKNSDVSKVKQVVQRGKIKSHLNNGRMWGRWNLSWKASVQDMHRHNIKTEEIAHYGSTLDRNLATFYLKVHSQIGVPGEYYLTIYFTWRHGLRGGKKHYFYLKTTHRQVQSHSVAWLCGWAVGWPAPCWLWGNGELFLGMVDVLLTTLCTSNYILNKTLGLTSSVNLLQAILGKER